MQCLFDEIEMTRKQSCIRSKLHEVYSVQNNTSLWVHTTTSDISCPIQPRRSRGDIGGTLIIICVLRSLYFTHILYFYILRFMYFTLYTYFLVLYFVFLVFIVIICISCILRFTHILQFYILRFLYFAFYTYFTLYILRFMYIYKFFVFL